MPAAQYHNRERAAQLAAFLKALSLGCTAKKAAAEAGLGLRSLYRMRRVDPLLAARWQAATSALDDTPTDVLELEAQRRAVTGIEKPVFRGGTCVGHTTDYSDSMLMFLLKAKYPEKYDRPRTTAQKPDTAKADTTGAAFTIAGARDALLSKFAQAAQ